MADDKDMEFARTYSPQRSPDSYDWVLKYGREQIEFLHRLVDVLEGKADALMRYIGAVALAVAGLPFLSQERRICTMISFAPALLGLAVAALCCMMAVRPTTTAALPSIHRAFRYADYFQQDAAVRFYATMVPFEPRLGAVIGAKAGKVRAAWWLFWASVFYLPVGVFLSVV